MADDPKKEKKLLREMLSMTDSVWHTPGLPKQLQEIAGSIHRDVREIERLTRAQAKPVPGGTKESKTLDAEKRIAEKTDKFGKLVR
jgi:hypothetical protein